MAILLLLLPKFLLILHKEITFNNSSWTQQNIREKLTSNFLLPLLREWANFTKGAIYKIYKFNYVFLNCQLREKSS